MTALKRFKLPDIGSKRLFSTGAIIVLSLAMFEIFSYSSNVEGFNTLWGSDYLAWSRVLAIALVMVDFGGLARNSDPAFAKTDASKWLWAGWSLSAFFDGFLTYVVVMYSIASRPIPNIVTAGVVSSWTWHQGIPILFAVFVSVIQILLVHRLEGEVAKRLGGSNAKTNVNPRRTN